MIGDGASAHLRPVATGDAVRGGPLGDALGFAAVYFGAALLAIHLSRQPGSIATVWFANAAGIALLACRPTRHWAGLIAAAMAANLGANLAYGLPPGLAVSFLPANALEMALGGWLVRRSGTDERFDDGVGPMLRLLVAGSGWAPLAGATLGALAIAVHGLASFDSTWLQWYVGSVLGIVATLPFAMSILKCDRGRALAQLLTAPLAAFVLLTLVVGYFAPAWLHSPFIFMSLPLIGAALLLPSMATFGLATLVVVIVAAWVGYGMIEPVVPASDWHRILLYVAAVAAVVPSQLLAVVAVRQRATAKALFALNSATSEIVAFIDTRGHYRIVNRAHELYYQRSREATIGQHVSQFVPEPRYSEHVAPALKRAFEGETVQYRTVVGYAGAGQRTMEITYQPAFDELEHPIGVLAIAHDVTDLVAAQAEVERRLAELRAANENLEQFVRIASHDLREPVNTMIQFSSLIRDDHGRELSPTAATYLQHVCSGSLRMRIMLDDVLNFVRLESTEHPHLEPLDLGTVVAQALGSLQAVVTERSARVEVRPMPRALGHDTLLTLLFQNLISNAIKFVPAGRTPSVVVSAAEDDRGFVVVSVADNGIGIPAQQLPQLFTPFKRLHSRRKFEGTGMGLAICRRIATAHGGWVDIQSTPGEGSRVRVGLQRAVG